jgi:hypothetical protein
LLPHDYGGSWHRRFWPIGCPLHHQWQPCHYLLLHRQPPPQHPPWHMEPHRAGAPLLQPLNVGIGQRHKPTLLGTVEEARREERGGVAEEQWKTKDLHPQHSGRPDGECQRRRHHHCRR